MSDDFAPKVTFALFAFNQENYVRAAIEGAFAQTFTPMEIILSDDCSSDRTFAIMEEMAAAYRGPHRVIARQERPNVGLVQHVINVARVAQGDLMIINAGDDISYPDRARMLYDAWQETGAAALASRHDEIDAEGRPLRQNTCFSPSTVTQWLFGNEQQAHRIDGVIQTVPGFCAAYPRTFWADLPDPPTRLMVEDGLASALIIFRGGKIVRVPQSLIAYRLLDNSLSDRSVGLSLEEVTAREAKIERHARDVLNQIAYILDQVRREKLPIHPRTLATLNKGRIQNELLVDFWKVAPFARAARLFRVRATPDAKFLLPRMFGFRAFAAFRILVEKRRQKRLADARK